MKNYIYPNIWKKFFFNILDLGIYYMLLAILYGMIDDIGRLFYTEKVNGKIKWIDDTVKMIKIQNITENIQNIFIIIALFVLIFLYFKNWKTLTGYFTGYKIVDFNTGSSPTFLQLLKRNILKYIWFIVISILFLIAWLNPVGDAGGIGVIALLIIATILLLIIQLIVNWKSMKNSKYQTWYGRKSNTVCIKEIQ